MRRGRGERNRELGTGGGKTRDDNRISLVVQWLRPQALNAGVLGSISARGIRSHML